MMDRRIFFATVAGLLVTPLAAEAQPASYKPTLAPSGGGRPVRGPPAP